MQHFVDELKKDLANNNLRLSEALRDYKLADYQYEILFNHIKEFEKDLDDEHEVALQLVAFGQSIILNITDIGYSNPCLVHFYGYYNGNYVELIQHINQLSFLLMSVPKTDPNKPARRIGFDTDNLK